MMSSFKKENQLSAEPSRSVGNSLEFVVQEGGSKISYQIHENNSVSLVTTDIKKFIVTKNLSSPIKMTIKLKILFLNILSYILLM